MATDTAIRVIYDKARADVARRGESAFIGHTDAARLVRLALARAFPGTTFWVRSRRESLSSAIDIFFDGRAPGAPALDAVRAVTDRMGGRGFDGSIDADIFNRAFLLPDGSVRFGGSDGTVYAGGRVPARPAETAPADAIPVRFTSWFSVRPHRPAA